MRKTKLFFMKKSMLLVFGISMLILPLVFSVPVFAKEYNLKMQAFLAGWDYDKFVKPLEAMIEKMSNGKIKVKSFPVGTLVPMKEMLNALRTGVLDMALIPEGYYAGVVPVSEIAAGLPYGFRNLDESSFFMWRRGFADILRKQYAKQGVYVIPIETFGVGLMTKKPVTKVEDLKGMKIRTFGVMAEWLKDCGASTVFIPGGELYTALATGVVGGATWGDAGPSYLMRFHEVLNNYLLPEPIKGGWVSLGINIKLWEKFTPHEKRAIQAAVFASGRIIMSQTRMMYQRAIVSMAKEHNVQMTTWPKAEQDKARKTAMKVWDRIAKKHPTNAKVIKMIEDFLAEKDVRVAGQDPWTWIK